MQPTISAESTSSSAENDALESPAAIQLRKGFPWLHFCPELEVEYRREHLKQTRKQVQFNLKLSLVCTLLFFAVGSLVHVAELTAELNVWRIGVILPAFICVLAVTYSQYYHRIFATLMQIILPFFGVCIVAEVWMASSYGVSFFAIIIVLIFSMQVLVGMLFYAAIRSSLIVSIAYVVSVYFTDMSLNQAVYNFAVLAVTNAVGAAACYALEKSQRTTYLEAKLLMEAVNRDGLTGIYNRRAFDEHLDKMWAHAGREQVPVGLLLIDIDHFKAFNDYYGHQMGDECLRHVARALAACTRRPLDCVARYGGEEFAIVLYGINREFLVDLARRIHASMAALAISHQASPVARQVTVSIGIAHVTPTAKRSRYGLIQLADEALYDVKGSGRNGTTIMDREYDHLTTGVFKPQKPI
jgi:diguanylate cyclase (GGDEF)-like protein